MKFEEAYKYYRSGYKIRRKDYAINIYFDEEKTNHMLVDSALADDWEVIPLVFHAYKNIPEAPKLSEQYLNGYNDGLKEGKNIYLRALEHAQIFIKENIEEIE